jgi:uncharacterized integral membrane protein
MKVGYLIVAVLATSVTLFALQNPGVTAVRFALWRLGGVPIAGLVLGSLGAGLLIAGLPLWIRLTVWRSRARSHETRATMLERTVEERDRQLLRMPPSTAPPARRTGGTL